MLEMKLIVVLTVFILKCEIVELNVQIDHVHLIVMIPPKLPVSNFVGTIKGKTASSE